MTSSRYFIVPAPGYYGDRSVVLSSHATFRAAQRAAGDACVVRIGGKHKGQEWRRVYEETYPIACGCVRAATYRHQTAQGVTCPHGQLC